MKEQCDGRGKGSENVGAGVLMLYPQRTTNTLYEYYMLFVCICNRKCIVCVRVGAERLPTPGGHPCEGAGCGGARVTWLETWRRGDDHVAFLSFFLPLPLPLLTYYEEALIHFWVPSGVGCMEFKHGDFALSFSPKNRFPSLYGGIIRE